MTPKTELEELHALAEASEEFQSLCQKFSEAIPNLLLFRASETSQPVYESEETP